MKRQDKKIKLTHWTDIHGIRRRIKDLSDLHIVNLIHYTWVSEGDFSLYNFFVDEAKRRGFAPILAAHGQTPHVGPDGKWHLWDFKKQKDIVVSKRCANQKEVR